MRVAAIICEYNPFHNGHKYHLDLTKGLGFTHVLSIMSGNFVQRGEAAIVSKWARTRSALESGVDLVLELPTIFSIAGAERFAMGAVGTLESTGVVDALSFGSESGEVETLKRVSEFILSEHFSRKLKRNLRGDKTFAKIREEVIRSELGDNFVEKVMGPNDILAVEYIKALKVLKSNIVPIAVKRKGNDHDSLISYNNIASASLVRHLINSEDDSFRMFMPKSSVDILVEEFEKGNAPASMTYAERAIIAKLKCMSSDELRNVMDVSEGLENRIFDAINKSVSLESIYDFVKTKRYTHARIRRIILSAFLGITKKYGLSSPDYIRVLGFNKRGREILHEMKKKSELPIITRGSDIKSISDTGKKFLEIQNRCDDLFSIFTPQISVNQFQHSLYYSE